MAAETAILWDRIVGFKIGNQIYHPHDVQIILRDAVERDERVDEGLHDLAKGIIVDYGFEAFDRVWRHYQLTCKEEL
jgi:hypothetical protein